jgi:hypothetical protein
LLATFADGRARTGRLSPIAPIGGDQLVCHINVVAVVCKVYFAKAKQATSSSWIISSPHPKESKTIAS